LYADDAKLFSNNSVDLQHALDKFSDWMHNRQLNLAPSSNTYCCPNSKACDVITNNSGAK